MSENEQYGSYGLIQSSKSLPTDIRFTPIANLTEALDEQDVWIRGRLHVSRIKGKMCFLTLRHQIYTVQVMQIVGAEFPKEMQKFIGSVSKVRFALLLRLSVVCT